MTEPKLFISYSWSSPKHEAWVLELATELRDSGVDVILDKWDLHEGHDAYAFMELMVTDPTVKKVLLICDDVYVEKADRRHGGVGTEAQILSRELYSKQDQTKFVALVLGYNDQDQPILPAYYSSRKYIDYSAESKHADAFDQILRWADRVPADGVNPQPRR